jgi:hypothetical protein
MVTTAGPSRRRVALGAFTVALGPLTFAVTTFLNPYGTDDDQVRVVRDEAAAVTTWSLVWLLASLLLVAAAATLVGHVRGRGSSLALVGGTLAGAGAVASAAIAGFESVALTLGSAISDDAALDRTLKEFDSSAVLGVLFALFVLASAVGWPLLVGGAARAGLLSAWFVAPVALAMVGHVIPLGDSPVLLLVGNALFVVPLLVLAYRIVRDRWAEELGGAPWEGALVAGARGSA